VPTFADESAVTTVFEAHAASLQTASFSVPVVPS